MRATFLSNQFTKQLVGLGILIVLLTFCWQQFGKHKGEGTEKAVVTTTQSPVSAAQTALGVPPTSVMTTPSRLSRDVPSAQLPKKTAPAPVMRQKPSDERGVEMPQQALSSVNPEKEDFEDDGIYGEATTDTDPNRRGLQIIYGKISDDVRGEVEGEEEEEDEDDYADKDKYDGPGLAATFEFERTKNPTTNTIPDGKLLQAIEQTTRAKSQAVMSRAATLAWSERGPYTDVVGPSNGNTRANNAITAGRVRATWVDLSDATGKTVWVGGIDGGLWKTTDITVAVPTWAIVNDFLSNLAVSGICQDPVTPTTMYFCTGEAYFNADRVKGNGVFKSTDGGATWAQLTSTASYPWGSRIQCDAAGNVYLGTMGSGLLRSTNGGSTWTAITPTGLTNNITDFEISSTGRMHVAVGYYEAGGGYRFTDAPATVTTATWTAPTTAFAYPSGTAARVELACLGNTLYAVPSNTSAVMSQIFKSINGGATWTTTALTTANITDLNGSTTGGQGWYCMGLEIDPSNANTAIVGGLQCLKTIDGGATWTKISTWVGTTGQYVHADIQNIKWYDGGNKLMIASDGGIFFSADKGVTFRDRNTNLRIKQFYSCAVHPNATTNPNYFLAGAQDNGTHQLNGAGISSSVEVTGGDGAYVAIDQDQPQYQYGAYVYNQYRRSTNGGTSWGSVNFSTSAGRFINPWEYDNTGNKIYGSWTAGNYMRWDDPQTGATMVAVPIPSLNGVTVGAVAVSPYTANQVYLGTISVNTGGGGRIVKVTNANTATPIDVNLTGATMPVNAYVNCINTGTDDNNLIVCFSSYGVNNVWVTTNGGTSWTAIDGNLPDMPVRWAVFAPGDNTKAYIATETGVWGTDLISGATTVWAPNTSFPTVRTDMLKYRAADGLLVAATHGRGLWSATIPTSGISAPIVGTVTQPTCATATGSVALSGLPATGTWTLTRSPDAVATTGTGTTTTVTGIPSGTYSYTVTNASSVTSPASTSFTINAQPATPTTPSVGTVTQPTCGTPTGSVVLNGLPATGTWTLTRSPGGVTTTGSGVSTTITGLAAGTYTYTVSNGSCTSVASTNVVINAAPTAPTTPSVGTITQPTCSLATGSVVLNGLPATGTWTLTRSPGAVTTTGTGVSTTITGLAAGTYTYTVASSGCTSVASANVVINAQPATPTTPSVGAITQPTCAAPTGTVVLSGLPATGTWTLTRTGGVTTTGTGVSSTITGLPVGATYNFTVTNAAGCTSVASANVVINAAPAAPTAPSVGAITQPTCTVATGSVVLSGLPTGTWTLTRSPGAVVTTGSTASVTITGLAAGTYTYTVRNAAGCTSVASASIVINAQPTTPTAPVVGTRTQPTCLVPTGSVVLSGLPATGTWTLTRTPGAVTTTGTGTSATITGIPAGATYTYRVSNGSCTSVASANVVINALPAAPTTPRVGTRTQPTCAVQTGSVVLSSLPSTGTWTLTRTPGGVTTTGTGTSTTVTGIPAGTYTYKVTNAAGCVSAASANVIINAPVGCLMISSPVTFNVSPNPAQKEVMIDADITLEGQYKVTVMDGIGKILITKMSNYDKGSNTEALDISILPKGVYFVRIAHTSGIDFAIKKLIVN